MTTSDCSGSRRGELDDGCDDVLHCDILFGMEKAERVPDGYEVKTDMFGLPYLQRKATPMQQRLSEILFVPLVILIVSAVCWLVLH